MRIELHTKKNESFEGIVVDLPASGTSIILQEMKRVEYPNDHNAKEFRLTHPIENKSLKINDIDFIEVIDRNGIPYY